MVDADVNPQPIPLGLYRITLVRDSQLLGQPCDPFIFGSC